MDRTNKVLVEVNANGEKRQYKTKRWKNIDVAIKEINKKLKKNKIKSIEHVNFKSKTSDKVVSGMDIVQDYRDSGSTDTLQQYIKKNYIINKKSKKEIDKLKKNKKDKANQDKENKKESSKDNPVKENKQDSNKENIEKKEEVKEDTEKENKEEVKEESKEENKDTQNNQDTQENKQDNKDEEKLDKNKKRRYTQISPKNIEELKVIGNIEFEKNFGEYLNKTIDTPGGKVFIIEEFKSHIIKNHYNEIKSGLMTKAFETLVNPDDLFPTTDKNGIAAKCYLKKQGEKPPFVVIARDDIAITAYTLKNKNKESTLRKRGYKNDK